MASNLSLKAGYAYMTQYVHLLSNSSLSLPTDISVNFHKQKKHGIRTWNISVYNVYNCKNPFIVYADYKWNEATRNLLNESVVPLCSRDGRCFSAMTVKALG